MFDITSWIFSTRSPITLVPHVLVHSIFSVWQLEQLLTVSQLLKSSQKPGTGVAFSLKKVKYWQFSMSIHNCRHWSTVGTPGTWSRRLSWPYSHTTPSLEHVTGESISLSVAPEAEMIRKEKMIWTMKNFIVMRSCVGAWLDPKWAAARICQVWSWRSNKDMKNWRKTLRDKELLDFIELWVNTLKVCGIRLL